MLPNCIVLFSYIIFQCTCITVHKFMNLCPLFFMIAVIPCHGFSIIQKITGFPKTLLLLVYFIRLSNKCTVKCNTIRYVYWYLQNDLAHSTFSIVEIHYKEGQCNLQPLLYEDSFNAWLCRSPFSLNAPLNLRVPATHLSDTYLGSYNTIAAIEVLCIHVHRSTFTTSTTRLAACEFCYYTHRWHTHQVCPAMYSIS